MNDIVWLTMRRMRTPLILLILVYSLSVFVMVMVPTVNPDGELVDVGYLDAAYFVAIMATTIGFGEIPYPFTEAQRLAVYLILLPNVVAWLYSIGTILSLFLDPQFRAVLKRSRFSRRVRWLGDPYFIVCGFGNTGSMVVSGLLHRGLHAVVLERDETTVQRMILDETYEHVPALAAEPSDRYHLELAGLRRPNCLGVIVTTSDDNANLKIAITSKLLRPELTVLARTENSRVSDNMQSFGTDFTIDPYAIFAERLFLALSSPVKYLVQDWLISVPGSDLREPLHPPNGRWIVCGAGRFGSRMLERLENSGLPFTVVDVHPDRLEGYDHAVLGRGTEASTLTEAGVADAVGIIAGTGGDVDNLSVIMTALELNRNLFVVARQESQDNDALFDASGAHLVARRSLIVARRILAVATTPLLQSFLQHMVNSKEDFAERTAARLKSVLEGRAPNLWVVDLGGELAEGLRMAQEDGVSLTLEDLTHNTRVEGEEDLSCACLVLERGAQRIFLPESDHELQEGDRLLFAGRGSARREMLWALTDANALLGYATGQIIPRGAIWRWFWRRRQQRARQN
ncbi:MAG: potassium channel protein [Xanthomonadales bacterium]|nr:potassium channel protein [Xanthomonadales bacterium]